MATTDARPIPRKDTAFRVTFPIFDADGDLVTGAAALACYYSEDAAPFAACSNTAGEIATGSGMYYLDLTAGEMGGDTVAILAQTSTSGAKTTPVVLYPEEVGDIRVNVSQIAASTTAATNLGLSALGVVTGATAAGTLSTTQATTDLTEATDNHYNGRVIVFTSGVLAGQASAITDYDGATKMLTYLTLTEAPGNGDAFVIV